MNTYLYLQKMVSTTPASAYRSKYPVTAVDYELWRDTNQKGDTDSLLRGGTIKLVISGFPDALLTAWVAEPAKRLNGTVTVLDESSRTIEKFDFERAKLISARMHYDSRLKQSVLFFIEMEAEEISTDRDLYYKKEK